ncbi:MAG: hypothetical protein S4CHLAM2_06160 [Chlamydiales bacterium]|nr:hypothetical protein [Chlamydiales bacterium]
MANHLQKAHSYWKETLEPGDLVIDATCGNGHDTLYLTRLGVQVVAYDIQEKALETARMRAPKATYRLQSHASFVEKEAALIVYNLGYLPGGDKKRTTQTETTLQSVGHALKMVAKALSITCYPGHPEGAKEEAALLDFTRSLDPKKWHVCYHQWLNRKQAPSLLWLVPLPS